MIRSLRAAHPRHKAAPIRLTQRHGVTLTRSLARLTHIGDAGAARVTILLRRATLWTETTRVYADASLGALLTALAREARELITGSLDTSRDELTHPHITEALLGLTALTVWARVRVARISLDHVFIKVVDRLSVRRDRDHSTAIGLFVSR